MVGPNDPEPISACVQIGSEKSGPRLQGGEKEAIMDEDETDAIALMGDEGPNTVCSTVKMKLNNFVTHAGLRAQIDAVVMKANYALAETYAFANLHITRVLNDGLTIPKINRNFYYACLSAVCVTNAKPKTVSGDIATSASLFDSLRPEGARKVDARDMMDVLSDLSISMATMAVNHLWENLSKRLLRYLKWRHPEAKGCHETIVQFAVEYPTMPLSKIDQLKVVGKKPLSEATIQRRLNAIAILERLRTLCPLQGGKHFASRAHLLLPIYHHMQRETELHFMDRRAVGQGVKLARTAARQFSLLPEKHGFTVSYIPISDRTLTDLVCRLKDTHGRPLEKLSSSRGKPVERRSLWAKYCNPNSVETRERRFAHRIVTDGVAVSVLLKRTQALVGSGQNTEWDPELLAGKENVSYAGVDPGVTDVATIARFKVGCGEPEIASYGSSRYYEKSKVKLSARRTRTWNKETEDAVGRLRTESDASTVAGQVAMVTAYLEQVRGLINHRATKGYRNMRFMRHVFKQKAVHEICDTIAPRDGFTVVGFGDWTGLGTTPISRRFCGPLQEIKRELKRRTDSVAFRTVWECKTSVTCHFTQLRLTNMVARSTVRDRKTKEWVQRGASKVHKVLHCKTSARGGSPMITTWNRDVNASRNILMLLMLEIRGLPRPAAFLPTSLARRASTKASAGRKAPVVAQPLSVGSP